MSCSWRKSFRSRMPLRFVFRLCILCTHSCLHFKQFFFFLHCHLCIHVSIHMGCICCKSAPESVLLSEVLKEALVLMFCSRMWNSCFPILGMNEGDGNQNYFFFLLASNVLIQTMCHEPLLVFIQQMSLSGKLIQQPRTT